jgi:NAD(P)-dependent dehydrogenase (short-subunit alcohol dehydrogenase family)
MDLQLLGKRALVTGSTAGIGYAIAEALVQGAAAMVNGRTKKRVNRAVEKLRARSSAARMFTTS